MQRVGSAMLCLGLLGYMIGCDVSVAAHARLTVQNNGDATKTANVLTVDSSLQITGRKGFVDSHTIVFDSANDADGNPIAPSSQGTVQRAGGSGEPASVIRFTATFPPEDLTRTSNKNRRPLTVKLTASGTGKAETAGDPIDAPAPIPETYTLP